MRPPTWNPPTEMSPTEQIVAKRIRKAKLFLFLRQIYHILFDEQFQVELVSNLFKDSTMGKCPVPPAQMVLFIILQAYTGVSDDEALEAMIMDRQWQLVLDCSWGVTNIARNLASPEQGCSSETTLIKVTLITS